MRLRGSEDQIRQVRVDTAAPGVNPEAPDSMEGALQSALVIEEHRTVMGAVMKKIQSVKGGLNEAFNILLTCFEVSNVMLLRIFICFKYTYITSSP